MKKITIMAALAMLAMGAKAQEVAGTATQSSDVLPLWEMIIFCIVVIGVIGLGIWKSKDPNETAEEKKAKGAADYFLAGRGLSWWLVGFSLIAANISTEQFVGMSGKAAGWVGFAIAGYEWLAAITLVVVAFTFLPMLLKRGVFTIPQFLEERFDGKARSMMAIANIIILVGVPTAAVIFAGAKVVSGYFDMDMTVSCIIIAACATIYVFVGGLKACAWTDLIWGAALIIGGGVVAYFALQTLGSADPAALMQTASATSEATVDSIRNAGAWERFMSLNGGEPLTATNAVGGKLSMVRPADDGEIPWTALCLGLWIPNFFYWGLNQYIMQRTLASKSLAEGQKGIVFAAALKLLIPFAVIVPGILAYNLYNGDMMKSANDKNVASIEAIEKSGKTPLYDVTADYMMAIKPSDEVADIKPIKYIIANFEVAASDAQKDQMGALLENFARMCTASPSVEADAAQVAKLADEYEISIPESVTDLDKKKRIVASFIALRAEKLNSDVIKSKAADAKFTKTETLKGYDYDSAFAMLLRQLLPGTGWAWFVLAALFGAVVSSLASMLNSASTLFTMDIYNKFRHEKASQTELVSVGKIAVLGCAVIALMLAIFLSSKLDSIFSYIQEFQGFLSPGAISVFIFGFFVSRCPRYFGWLGIAMNIVLYGLLKLFCSDMVFLSSFLNRMAVCLIVIMLTGAILSFLNRKAAPVVMEDKGIVETKASQGAKIAGAFVCIATVALYVIFW